MIRTKAPSGSGLHAVLGLAAPEAPEPRPEAEEELGGLHARSAGGDVVAELVEEDRDQDADDERRTSSMLTTASQISRPRMATPAITPDGAGRRLVVVAGRLLGHRAAGHDLVAEPVVAAALGRAARWRGSSVIAR